MSDNFATIETVARGAGRNFTLRRYLSNMEMIYKPIVEEAIEKSGRTDICIDPNPIPPNYSYNEVDERYYSSYRVHTVGRFFSVYVDEPRRMSYDCSDFWNVYTQLSKTPQWEVYLKLARD